MTTQNLNNEFSKMSANKTYYITKLKPISELDKNKAN